MSLKRFLICAAVGVVVVLIFFMLRGHSQQHAMDLVRLHKNPFQPLPPATAQQKLQFAWKPIVLMAAGLALMFLTKNDKAQSAGGVLFGASTTALLAS
jgi:phosphotransferase system  glucose/maltose/N-acetylglucosamine-specific IIC component